MDQTAEQVKNSSRKKVAFIAFGLIAVLCAIASVYYLRHRSTHISTDDAFIEGRIHAVSSRVPGTVRIVHVRDNQFVKKGDVIVEIDPSDYEVRMKEAESGLSAERAKLAEAEARIVTARRQLDEMDRRLDVSRANLELQEANLRQADIDMKRAESLIKKEAISRERHEKAGTAYASAAAQLKAAKEQVRLAESSAETQKAVIRQAESAIMSQAAAVGRSEAVRRSADLNVGYTKIYAPADGHITKKSVQEGNLVQAGQPLMAVVPLDDIWVTANYKETQLADVRPGQEVAIRIDMFGGRKFRGRVESIMAGTGSAFSLFPPENATGNFVKVVQRIPVKILFEKNADAEHVLRVGMSVEPTIIINK